MAAAIVAAPAGNKKRRLSDAKKDTMKSQLASQEEDKMLKEKLGEVQKQLRGASYHTLLAVSAFIDAGANMMDKAFPRCVKTYGGASNRAVPIKVVIEALAAMTEWEVGAMKSLQDNSELRCLFLYALGKEEGDELTATCMVIKQFVAECADLYQTLGCRLAGLSLEGKAKAGVNWQGEDSVGYLFIMAAGADKVPTHIVHRPTMANTRDMDKSSIELPLAMRTTNITIASNWSQLKVELLGPDGLHWKPPTQAMLAMYTGSLAEASATEKAKEDIMKMKVSSVAAGAAAAACEAIEDAKPEPSPLLGEGADEEVPPPAA